MGQGCLDHEHITIGEAVVFHQHHFSRENRLQRKVFKGCKCLETIKRQINGRMSTFYVRKRRDILIGSDPVEFFAADSDKRAANTGSNFLRRGWT